MTNRPRLFSTAARYLAAGILPILLAAACESEGEEHQGVGSVDAGHDSSGSNSVSGASGGGTTGGGEGVGLGGTTTGGNGAGTSGGAAGAGGASAGTGGLSAGAGGAPAGAGGTTGGAVGSDAGNGASGTGEDGGSSGGEAGTGSSPDAGTGACERGQVAGNEVLIVGDSYFALGGEITRELRRLSGANYRDVSVSGTKMGAIARSYANNRNPQPKVVIMDGGGNDILQNPFCATGCAQHVQAVTDARNLFMQMAMDGVQDVVFLFYYDMPLMKEGLDWMRPRMAAECQQSPVPCHFVDNQPLFAGQDASTYTTDGIHPNKAASGLIAKQVWDRMTQDCVAQ